MNRLERAEVQAAINRLNPKNGQAMTSSPAKSSKSYLLLESNTLFNYPTSSCLNGFLPSTMESHPDYPSPEARETT
jgi:hypothetical protein